MMLALHLTPSNVAVERRFTRHVKTATKFALPPLRVCLCDGEGQNRTDDTTILSPFVGCGWLRLIGRFAP
jgi:hypothetical protein